MASSNNNIAVDSAFNQSSILVHEQHIQSNNNSNSNFDNQRNNTEENEVVVEVVLFHPSDFGTLTMPKHLSPSSAMEFKECPQSFLFQYMYKLTQPTNLALAKGSMTHSALEHIFDLDPPDRSLENLQNMYRAEWSGHRLKDEYKCLFEKEDGTRDIVAEMAWGQSALQLLENYYKSEDPKTIVRPNPYKREVWVNADLTLDPTLGVTSSLKKKSTMLTEDVSKKITSTTTTTITTGPSSTVTSPETFKVRGIIDRLDMVKVGSRKVAMKIVDYKTGKAPTLKYSDTMNKQIYQKNFYQLKIYALLLREKEAHGSSNNNDHPDQQQQQSHSSRSDDTTRSLTNANGGIDLRFLKLYYLDSEKGRAQPWEMDLGETQEERDEVLNVIHQDLAQIWRDVTALVATQDPKSFVHCDRPFCSCHTTRAKFVPGTVWDKLSSTTSSSSENDDDAVVNV
jgi:hypothetical protein